jgi:hypothetical protein
VPIHASCIDCVLYIYTATSVHKNRGISTILYSTCRQNCRLRYQFRGCNHLRYRTLPSHSAHYGLDGQHMHTARESLFQAHVGKIVSDLHIDADIPSVQRGNLHRRNHTRRFCCSRYYYPSLITAFSCLLSLSAWGLCQTITVMKSGIIADML